MLDAGFDRPDAQAGVPEDLLVPSTSAPSAAPQDRSLITLLCIHLIIQSLSCGQELNTVYTECECVPEDIVLWLSKDKMKYAGSLKGRSVWIDCNVKALANPLKMGSL